MPYSISDRNCHYVQCFALRSATRSKFMFSNLRSGTVGTLEVRATDMLSSGVSDTNLGNYRPVECEVAHV
jgi:hypothetical protein